MANGEWLTQLLSGLGGAFTGEVAARGRIAEEEEAKRRREEQQAERDRLKRIQTLRQQPLTKETMQELLAAGESPSNISAQKSLSESFIPKGPEYSNKIVGPKGEVYFAEPGTGRSIRAIGPDGKPLFERVPSERDGPSLTQQIGESKRDVRAAQSELRGAEGAFRRALSGRPRQSQFKDPLTGLADTAAFGEALRAWRPESTYAAERRTGAQQDVATAEAALRRMMGQPEPTPRTGIVPNASMQQQVAMEMQDAIRRIQASALSPEEKRMRIEQVNQRATALLRAGGR